MSAQTKRIKIGGDKLTMMAAIVVVFIIFTALNRNFFTLTNIVNILVAGSLVGLVAIGHTYLIIAAQNDLSPGAVVAFSGVLAALLSQAGLPFGLVCIITLISGAVIGIFNAFMVNKIKLDPFIATLVTQSVIRGFAYIICDGKPVSITDNTYLLVGKLRIFGVPLSVWIMIIFIVIFGIILAKTTFGKNIYAIGGNKDAARLAGLNPQRIILICFIQ